MIQEIPQTIVERLGQSNSFRPPVTKSLALPIFEVPNFTLDYPVIDVPTQEQFDIF